MWYALRATMAILLKNRIHSWLLVFAFLHSTSALWYNRPKFCANSTWNPNATTFANQPTIGAFPHGLFINANNTVYAGNWDNSVVQVWHDGDLIPRTNITAGLYRPWGLFVAMNGDVYIDNGDFNGRVDKWTLNATNSVMVMNISVPCVGLFLDTNDTLYCSLSDMHKIVRSTLTTGTLTPTTVAGNGSAGYTSDLLCYPFGIVVDINFNLYVSDRNNDRIQLFQYGQLNGTTVAGNTAPIIFLLNRPTSIVLDADGYLFILDTGNSRIVGSSSNGFRCVVGCSGISGSTPDKLFNARYMAFDNYGNIFVTDDDNNRIQKFILASNSCACDLSDYLQYKISNNIDDFDNAQTCCRSMNMTLLEIDSAKKQARLMGIATYTQDWFYIGLDGWCTTSNYTQWLSGKEVTYSNWGTGQPTPCLTSRQCVITGNLTGTNQWKIVNCSIPLRFICEPYVVFGYTLTRSTLLGIDTDRAAYANITNQLTTIFEQVAVQSSTLVQCLNQCLMNDDCIAINFDYSECHLAVN